MHMAFKQEFQEKVIYLLIQKNQEKNNGKNILNNL